LRLARAGDLLEGVEQCPELRVTLLDSPAGCCLAVEALVPHLKIIKLNALKLGMIFGNFGVFKNPSKF